MPTEPFKQLFDPELSKAAAKDRNAAAVALIEEIRNYGHALFARCAYRPEGGDENMAILFLYYHLIEMLDAVGILVSESAPIPAELQLRAIFEALVSLSFILKADTPRRGYAYLVCAFGGAHQILRNLGPVNSGRSAISTGPCLGSQLRLGASRDTTPRSDRQPQIRTCATWIRRSVRRVSKH